MDELIKNLSTLDPMVIYVIIFAFAFIENIFPPAPSDVLVIFGGALAAMEKGHYLPALIAGATGGAMGFMVMYGIGKWFGKKILETGKIKFINLKTVHKIEQWFIKYGYWIIVANRFLTGTRAVVSFFAGMSEINFKMTTLLSFVSSLVWYGILVYFGYSLGGHWEKAVFYLKSYTEIITLAVIAAVVVWGIIYLLKRNHSKKSNV